jgi:hypothetical protein
MGPTSTRVGRYALAVCGLWALVTVFADSDLRWPRVCDCATAGVCDEVKGGEGTTPLMVACEMESFDVDMLCAFMHYGANIRATTKVCTWIRYT